MPPTRFFVWCLAASALLWCPAPIARGLDAEHRAAADQAIGRGLSFLRQTQNPNGSWSPDPGPAITGLILTALLDDPVVDPTDPAVERALGYILARVQPDGSIRDGENGALANYNTAICLSALARVEGHPGAAEAVRGAQAFLKGLQWSGGDVTPDGQTVTRNHPYFGGAGYGKHGRPDMSNTQILLQGLYDSGVSSEDPAFARAVEFIARCQGTPGNGFFNKGTIVEDGGFIYATSINKDHPQIPVSYANPDLVDEARAGRPVSGLRGYGSVTYAGFKSYLYANLGRDDPRVLAAVDWIQNNYTLDQNPGMPESVKHQGLFYYYLAHARALRAWGSTTLEVAGERKTATVRAAQDTAWGEVVKKLQGLEEAGYEVSLTTFDPASEPGEPGLSVRKSAEPAAVDWANNLIAKLAQLQQPNGSFVNAEPRWLENDPNLVTAYSVLALQEAIR